LREISVTLILLKNIENLLLTSLHGQTIYHTEIKIIGDKIKAFELKLQNKNACIVNLYIEGNGVDFCIVENN